MADAADPRVPAYARVESAHRSRYEGRQATSTERVPSGRRAGEAAGAFGRPLRGHARKRGGKEMPVSETLTPTSATPTVDPPRRPSRAPAAATPTTGTRAIGVQVAGATALGAVALGALVLGAVAVGSFFIGRLSVRRLWIRDLAISRARIAHLHVDELTVGRMRRDRAGWHRNESAYEHR
jgi:hypothetical protein